MRRKFKQEDHRRALVARHGLAATAAVAAEAAISYPLETLKALKQVCANSLNPKPEILKPSCLEIRDYSLKFRIRGFRKVSMIENQGRLFTL